MADRWEALATFGELKVGDEAEVTISGTVSHEAGRVFVGESSVVGVDVTRVRRSKTYIELPPPGSFLTCEIEHTDGLGVTSKRLRDGQMQGHGHFTFWPPLNEWFQASEFPQPAHAPRIVRVIEVIKRAEEQR
jgi:hypothetical protein